MSEHDEQVALFQWAALMSAQYPELELLYAVPNGAKLPYRKGANGKRYSPEAMRLKSEGLKPGVPDVVWPVARNGFHGLYLELKWKGNKPSENQEWWLDRLAEQGYLAVACWGAQDAIETICEYAGIPYQANFFSRSISYSKI